MWQVSPRDSNQRKIKKFSSNTRKHDKMTYSYKLWRDTLYFLGIMFHISMSFKMARRIFFHCSINISTCNKTCEGIHAIHLGKQYCVGRYQDEAIFVISSPKRQLNCQELVRGFSSQIFSFT